MGRIEFFLIQEGLFYTYCYIFQFKIIFIIKKLQILIINPQKSEFCIKHFIWSMQLLNSSTAK